MAETDSNSRGPEGNESISVGSLIGGDLNPNERAKIAGDTTSVMLKQAPINVLIVDDEPKNLTSSRPSWTTLVTGWFGPSTPCFRCSLTNLLSSFSTSECRE
jgi:hypothetical protein